MNDYELFEELKEVCDEEMTENGTLDFARAIDSLFSNNGVMESLGIDSLNTYLDVEDEDEFDNRLLGMYLCLFLANKFQNDIVYWLIEHGHTPEEINEAMELVTDELEGLI